ncbi:MAG: ArsA family ATPase [Anaerolineae bacterium]
MRIILYTGKGGVGKTTVAAATALRCAELGHGTIVLSTDPAHSLSDAFDIPLAPEPEAIAPNLWGQEMDVYYSIEKHWATLQRYMAAVFSWQGVEDMLAEEMSVIPGMEEGASLLWINQHYEEGKYDVMIVDCAPTAETLRLLSIPDVGRWWFSRLFPIGRSAVQILGPVARPFLQGMPLPDRETLDAAEGLFKQLAEIHRLLSDPKLSSVRLVLNPEKMVIKEAQRTFTYLNLYGYVTDAVICNRLIPEEAEGGYFDAWREAQTRYYRLVEEGFSPLPILKVPFFDQEVVGLEMLRRMADALFGQEDPTKLFFQGQTHRIEPWDEGYLLIMSLPFVEKGDISLLRSGDELTVQVGSYRRNLILPHVLRGLTAQGARFEGGLLKIRFI